MERFLDQVALVSDLDAYHERDDCVSLMTAHSAKGLEFPIVFMVGMEEGIFPHAASARDKNGVEEERRLCYVGMTRARKRLYLSFANMRRRMGVIEGGMPSRFLRELPEECLDGTVATGAGGVGEGSQATFDGFDDDGGWRRRRDVQDYSQEEVIFAVGMRVHHNDFGRGVVRKVEGAGGDMRVTVIFDRGGERKFIAQYAPMRPE